MPTILTPLRLPINCLFHSPCVELSYYDQGSGDTVIFIHGLGANAASWRKQMFDLIPDYRVIAMDLRSHGQSGYRADEAITLKALADDIINLMMNLDLNQAHFCGLSMGGSIALEIFMRYRSKIKSLTLADSAPFYPPPALLQQRLQLLESMEMADWGRLVALLTLRREASYEEREEVAQMFAANRRVPYRQALIATFNSNYNWLLPLIDVPTLIMIGEEDQVTPIGLAMHLHMHIKGSVLRVIPGAAHLSNLENPAEFNRHLKEHLHKFRKSAQA
jgi:3-oxoadipate enol-lactonase